mgnify:CR=1 FL=1
MATKQGNNLILEESKLRNQIKKTESDINALKKSGAKADDERIKKLKIELDIRKDNLDKFKLQNSEARQSIKLAKNLATQAVKHTNVLFRQKAIFDNISNIGAEIARLAKSKDKFDKKVVKNYKTTLDLTESIMHNTKSIGTEEFQKVNLTSQIVKLKKLEKEASDETTKGGLKNARQHLELMKEAQDIMESQHASAQAAAGAIMAPFIFITATFFFFPLFFFLLHFTLFSLFHYFSSFFSSIFLSSFSSFFLLSPSFFHFFSFYIFLSYLSFPFLLNSVFVTLWYKVI